jgi:hypothetical protein
MDVRIEAAPMAADVSLLRAAVTAFKKAIHKALSLIEAVASFSCPSIGGTSISAVAPDTNFIGGTA